MTSLVAEAPVRTAEGAIAFTDVSGFTEFTALRGDIAALRLLQAQERILRNSVSHRGRVVKNLGDGFLLWFRSAYAAVDIALDLQEAFDAEAADVDMPLWVRIGIHYGDPVRYGRDLIGHDVNVAARIVDLAAPGEVLVSGACTEKMHRRLDNVYFEELGPVVMKGIPDAVPLFRAIR
jgi:class 3 adenylate cyclase